MPLFTRENSVQYREQALAARRANKLRREQAAKALPDIPTSAHECNARLWEIIAAIDRRLLYEAEKPRPTAALMRELAATRRTLLAQADGPEPVKEQPGKVQPPVLAEPEPVQE